MKKIIVVIILTSLVTGCTWLSGTRDTTPVRTSPSTRKVVSTVAKSVVVADFYFETDQNGLTLRLSNDKNFRQKLSNNPIESADISTGILTFVERIGNNTQTQAFHLEALAEQLNLGK